MSLWAPLVVLALLSSAGDEAVDAKVHHKHGRFTTGPWKPAHATFYGGRDGSDTRAGACGYKDTVAEGYGLQTAAVSTAMFNAGETCGACYEVRCTDSPEWCKAGTAPLTVTATNLCPPNYQLPGDDGGWSTPPREHLDLTMPAFLQIAEEKAGIVPILYRRVPCMRLGGIRYTITGNKYFNMVAVTNVGGAGDVAALKVKGNKRVKWTLLQRNWGQVWQTSEDLTGESLTFRVMTGDHRKHTSWHVLPRDWQFGVTYQAPKNF
ncbi:Expansin-A32 [Triticum urartu]|uniref:Expansin n=2 Tax=Triticum urartu TaxID=4572 RepID=M7ZX86_TRIUA|nr:expansin-A32-like [Triticum urartu]EMS52744.1 Expansin-A32 [Triticum urartu]